MRALGDTRERVLRQAQRAEGVAAAARLMRNLTTVVVREDYVSAEPGAPTGGARLRYRLHQHQLQWVGIMPARPAMGGRTEFRLGLEPDAYDPHRQHLVLRYRPWTPPSSTAFADWSSAAAEILAEDVVQFEIQVRGDRPRSWPPDRPWSAEWRSDWPDDVAELPQAIWLQIADRHGPWPPLISPVMPTPPSLARLSQAVIGGSPVRGGVR